MRKGHAVAATLESTPVPDEPGALALRFRMSTAAGSRDVGLGTERVDNAVELLDLIDGLKAVLVKAGFVPDTMMEIPQ
jgi:hypothetical protein